MAASAARAAPVLTAAGAMAGFLTAAGAYLAYHTANHPQFLDLLIQQLPSFCTVGITAAGTQRDKQRETAEIGTVNDGSITLREEAQPTTAAVLDWAQSVEEVLVVLQLPAGVTSRSQLHVAVSTRSLTVTAHGGQLLSAQLAGDVVPASCTWQLEGSRARAGGRETPSGARRLMVTLVKARQPQDGSGGGGGYELWTVLLQPQRGGGAGLAGTCTPSGAAPAS